MSVFFKMNFDKTSTPKILKYVFIQFFFYTQLIQLINILSRKCFQRNSKNTDQNSQSGPSMRA